MIIYNYSSDTFEFTCAGDAMENPMSPGSFLIPAYATQLEVPETKENEVAIFNNKSTNENFKSVGDTEYCPDAEWEIKPDFRGTTVYTEQGIPYTIDKIGEVVDTTKYLTLEELNSRLVKESTFNFSTRRWVLNIPALKIALITKAGEYKYDLQESTVVSNEIFSNKTAKIFSCNFIWFE